MESASSPRLIPRSRRRYKMGLSSNSPCNSPGSGESCSMDVGVAFDGLESVRGTAFLCFWEDRSRFEGYLTTDNESHYGLVGKYHNDDNSSVINSDSSSPPPPKTCFYNVTLVDQDDEESFHFRRVSVVDSAAPLCSLLSTNFSFNAKVIYRGQKADMLIQRYITPRLVGQNLIVYSGTLSAEISRPTSQPNSWKDGPLWYL